MSNYFPASSMLQYTNARKNTASTSAAAAQDPSTVSLNQFHSFGCVEQGYNTVAGALDDNYSSMLNTANYETSETNENVVQVENENDWVEYQVQFLDQYELEQDQDQDQEYEDTEPIEPMGAGPAPPPQQYQVVQDVTHDNVSWRLQGQFFVPVTQDQSVAHFQSSGNHQARSTDSSIRGPDGHINTTAMMSKLSNELRIREISQKKFAENVLDRRQGTLSEMIRAPKPWEKCKSVKKVYETILAWLELPESEKLMALEQNRAEGPKKRALSEEGDTDSPAAKRFRFCTKEKNILMKVFNEWNHPNKLMIQKIATVMEIPDISVKSFFQNIKRRAIPTEGICDSEESIAMIDMLKKYEAAGKFG